MTRKPTPIAEIYAWHRAALAGNQPPVTTEPHCGWFKRRLVKGGPYVVARIWLEQDVDPETGELVSDEIMRCEIDGKACDPTDQWTWLAGRPISEHEYTYRSADANWCRQNAPASPEATPKLPVSSRTIPPLF